MAAQQVRTQREIDAEFDTPEKAYAEAERRIAQAQASTATELRVQLRYLDRLPPSLAGLTALQTLTLDRTQVADLAPLAGLTALQTLTLDRTQVADLAPLAGLTALQTLTLDDTQVADLAPLAGLTALQTLTLDRTQVADLAPLAGLTALQTLTLAGTQVADLAPLAGLTALQWLWLAGTQVADLAPLAGLTALADAAASDTKPITMGLSYAGTPVAKRDPFSKLVTLDQPDRTIKTINYLRAQRGLPPHVPGTSPTSTTLTDDDGRPIVDDDGLSILTDDPAPPRQSPPNPAAVPPQRERGLHYGGPLSEPIHELPDEPHGALRDTADQRELFAEIKDGSARLIEACGSSNQLAELKGEAAKLAKSMGDTIPSLQPHLGRFWFALDKLRADEAEEKEQRGKPDRFSPEMPSEAYRRLGVLVRRLNEFVVGEPQLDARDRRSAGPDALQATEEALAAAKSYVEAVTAVEGLQDAEAAAGLKEAAEHAAQRPTQRATEHALDTATNHLKEVVRRAAEVTAEAAKTNNGLPPDKPPAKSSWLKSLAKGTILTAATTMAGKYLAGITVQFVVEHQLMLKSLAKALPPSAAEALTSIIDQIIAYSTLFF